MQIFCLDQIGLKFVGPSAFRTLADFLSRLTVLRRGRVIQNQDGAYSSYVPLMTLSNWLRRARATTTCLAPPHTSRQGPTGPLEI